ncbi:hypothetical protein PEX1_021270 [Penicillium expansum]|uniref:Uncharacterized protein n=1 Tax=Penicillium expansum TaxID=27334 RepID=A0A0A2HY66_PENEN|nr:hypothetical protein PEX2_088020 [Penicillium expansum]KGO35944.1 hypothetical protein PEXP_037320 [Penicillium expansum]KGO48332.1 hypothetical protein PEX1_021270 [Penicillium expansum]KGO60620.1 hypothetical protein PEX2_088020 [Penicillium expansum]
MPPIYSQKPLDAEHQETVSNLLFKSIGMAILEAYTLLRLHLMCRAIPLHAGSMAHLNA